MKERKEEQTRSMQTRTRSWVKESWRSCTERTLDSIGVVTLPTASGASVETRETRTEEVDEEGDEEARAKLRKEDACRGESVFSPRVRPSGSRQ